ncbi:protein CFAP20DC [Alosa pseudoharengus]|uniref:protein CFAP20DC n=1 Tax=Alosa pseudoharengus TaxID=34774 RepID=UPI003F8BB80F
MFKNEYQGGPVVEIFSAQGKDPVAKWKLSGGPSGISKEFDKEVKGFVYCLEGSSQTNRMQIPRDSKMGLGLVQKFLVLQVKVPLGKDFSTELLITDAGHLKRRLYLSTVHKEVSATPLHARIPLTSLAHNEDTWCNMCIDVGSFTQEMFKGAVFMHLDSISISASCKVRRIFTMKAEPADSDRDLYIYRHGRLDEIPRACQFPVEVQHITQVISMKTAPASDVRAGSWKTDSEQTGPPASARSTKSHDSSHVAFGSRVARPPPPIGKKNNPAPSRQGQEDKGRSWKLQPRPPPDRPASEQTQTRRPQMHSAGRERPILTERGIVPQKWDEVEQAPTLHPVQPAIGHNRADASEDEVTSLCSLEDGCLDGSDQEAGQLDDEPDPLSVPCEALAPLSAPLAPGQRGDSDVSDKEEPLLVLEEEEEEEVFTFSSRPHSARRGQGLSNSVQDMTFDPTALGEDDGGMRKEARPEDDFIGSESEEDDAYAKFLLQRGAVQSSPAPCTSLEPSRLASGSGSHRKSPGEPRQTSPKAAGPTCSPGVSEGSRRPDHGGVAPTRCLSPGAPRLSSRLERPGAGKSGPGGDCRMSLSKRSLREIPPEDWRIQAGDGGRRAALVLSGGGLPRPGDAEEEERRMLASLCREQTEDDDGSGGGGLSASQRRRCNVSLSTSSDDTTTWTQCYPVPDSQGQYYQKEMNPLLHSNPREWMDVLSPPVIPPSQQRVKCKDDLCKVTDEGADNSCDGEEFLNLLYDPGLSCYFDPQSGKYYELA